jgi:hypothetical protein
MHLEFIPVEVIEVHEFKLSLMGSFFNRLLMGNALEFMPGLSIYRSIYLYISSVAIVFLMLSP